MVQKWENNFIIVVFVVVLVVVILVVVVNSPGPKKPQGPSHLGPAPAGVVERPILVVGVHQADPLRENVHLRAAVPVEPSAPEDGVGRQELADGPDLLLGGVGRQDRGVVLPLYEMDGVPTRLLDDPLLVAGVGDAQDVGVAGREGRYVALTVSPQPVDGKQGPTPPVLAVRHLARVGTPHDSPLGK